METALFFFKVKESPNTSDNISGLTSQIDFQDCLKHFAGKNVKITIDLIDEKKSKSNMMAYYHKVLIPIARECFKESFEVVDDVLADTLLKCECAKKESIDKKGNSIIYTEDKHNMGKKRLHRYLSDCISFLELQYGVRIPDATSWKIGGNLDGFTSIR